MPWQTPDNKNLINNWKSDCLSLRSFNCPHTKSGHKGARNLSYQPNNVSFVWGNLVEGRCLVTIDYIFTALLYYVLKSSTYILQILFSWQLWKFFQLQNYYTTCKSSQLSSGGTKTHSQVFKLQLISSLCWRYSIVRFVQWFCPLCRQVMGGTEGLPCLEKGYLLPCCQPLESKADFPERWKKGLNYSGLSHL